MRGAILRWNSDDERHRRAKRKAFFLENLLNRKVNSNTSQWALHDLKTFLRFYGSSKTYGHKSHIVYLPCCSTGSELFQTSQLYNCRNSFNFNHFLCASVWLWNGCINSTMYLYVHTTYIETISVPVCYHCMLHSNAFVLKTK